MPRTLPPELLRELNRQESAELLLVFMTITHPTLTDVIRVVSDPRSFVLDGETHVGFRFDIRLLTDNEAAPFAQLTIQNVDKRIPTALLNVNQPARVHIQVIAGSEFDLNAEPCGELGGPGSAQRIHDSPMLYMTEVEADAIQITARIVSWDYTQELWPGMMATKDRFPGLFR